MTRIEFEAERRTRISGVLWRPLVMEGLRSCYIISEKREVYDFQRCRLMTHFDDSVRLGFEDGRHSVCLNALMPIAFPERYADAPGEAWREVIWDEKPTGYEVSSLGGFRRKDTKQPVKPDTYGGYCSVRMSIANKKQHVQLARLVARAFIENPHQYPFVRHKDRDPMNNAADNLEWSRASRNYEKGKS